MNARSLIDDLKSKGVIVSVRENRLVIDAPEGILSPDLIGSLKERKPEIMKLLSSGSEKRDIPPSATEPLKPFGIDPRVSVFNQLVREKCQHHDDTIRDTWLKVIFWPGGNQAGFAFQVGALMKRGVSEPDACQRIYEEMTTNLPNLKGFLS